MVKKLKFNLYNVDMENGDLEPRFQYASVYTIAEEIDGYCKYYLTGSNSETPNSFEDNVLLTSVSIGKGTQDDVYNNLIKKFEEQTDGNIVEVVE